MIPVAHPLIGEREVEYVLDCLKSGWISSLGSYIPRFEEAFAGYCGARYGIATCNGTAALHLALAVLGIGPGDEVIVPALTFVATANAVTYTGATPVFADVEPSTWNLDPTSLEARVTPRTRAIIPVHLYGHPADMDAINQVARRHGLHVIEDAAEAHGAQYRGKRVGSLGTLACFSFYGNKIITTGEGGMVLTDDPELAERAAWLRDHAMAKERRYWHPAIGFNYRMTNLQAAVGLAQLERIDQVIAKKREIARSYAELLANVPGLELPPEAPWAYNVYWMYTVLVKPRYGRTRDELAAHLRERGIDTRPVFYPLHLLPPYAKGESLPVAERLGREGISLPSGPVLSEDALRAVATALQEPR